MGYPYIHIYLIFIQKAEEYREQYEKYLANLTPEERAKAEEMDGWNKHKKAAHTPTKTDTSGSPEVHPVTVMCPAH